MSDPRIFSGIGQAGWRLYHHESASSTNDLARDLPPWAAVRADFQTAGRGRFGRAFQCEQGGLWLSAVVPTPGGAKDWLGFSLMAGCHIAQMIRACGVATVRLRWPNDVLVGSRKLGGLLSEQSQKESLVVGIGVNVTNRPWVAAPELADVATCLADVLPKPPDIPSLTALTLDAIADAQHAMQHGGLESAVAAFNGQIGEPLQVVLLLNSDRQLTGRFLGLNSEGHLRVVTQSGKTEVVEHNKVARLMESKPL